MSKKSEYYGRSPLKHGSKSLRNTSNVRSGGKISARDKISYQPSSSSKNHPKVLAMKMMAKGKIGSKY
jgi:hypothetical protein